MRENDNEGKKFDIAEEYKTINAISSFFTTMTYLMNVKTNMEDSERKKGQYPHTGNVKEQIEKGLNGIEEILKSKDEEKKEENNNNNEINNENQNNNENDVNQNKAQITIDALKASVKDGNFFAYEGQLNNNENQKQISSNDVSQIYNNWGDKLIHNLKSKHLEEELGALNEKIDDLNNALKNKNLNDASEKQKQIKELTKLENIKKNFIVAMDTWFSSDENMKSLDEDRKQLRTDIGSLKKNAEFQKVYDESKKAKPKNDNDEVRNLDQISDDDLIEFLDDQSEAIKKDINSALGGDHAQANNLITNIKKLNTTIKKNEKDLSDDFKKINDMIKSNSSDVSKEKTDGYLKKNFVESDNFHQNKFNNKFFKDVLLRNTSDNTSIQNQMFFEHVMQESLTDMENDVNGSLSSVNIQQIGPILLNAFDENENQNDFDEIFKDQDQMDKVINNLEALSKDDDYKKFIQKILSNKGLSKLLQYTSNKLVNKFKNKQYEELPWYKKIISPLKFISYQWRNHKAATILKTLGVVGIGGGISAAALFAPALLMASIYLAIAIVAIYIVVKLFMRVFRNRGKNPEQTQENEKDSTYYANKLYTMATAFGLNYDSFKELAEKTTDKSGLSKNEKKALNNSLKSIENMYKTYHNSISASGKYDILKNGEQNKQRAIIKFQEKNKKENNIIPKNKSVYLPLKIAKDLEYNVDQNNKDKQIEGK